MKKILIFIVVLISLSVFVSGVTNNITAFDDGSSDFNITANTTKYVTLLLNASIEQANISVKELDDEAIYDSKVSMLPAVSYKEDITMNNTYFWVSSSGFRAIYKFLHNGSYVDGFATPSGIGNQTYGLTTNNSFIWVTVSNARVFKFNMDGTLVSDINISSFFPQDCCIGEIHTNNTYFWVQYNSATNKIYRFNMDLNETTLNFSLQPGVTIDGMTKFGDYLYFVDKTTSEVLKYNVTGKYINSFVLDNNNSAVEGIEFFNGYFYTIDYNEDYFYKYKTVDYPSNVLIKVNDTIVFNHMGNLTGINASININTGNVMENYVDNNATVPIHFLASNWGKLNIFDLFIKYNQTNIANLNFISPSQITKTSTGGDYTVEITMENTGDWNATNCSFRTVSSGTPNLNDDMTYSNFSVLTTAQTTVNLTFSISESAEPDEKLQFYCNGTDTGEIVYSDFIDVDITYSVPDSGGGGGKPPKRCNWIIWKPRNKVWIGEGWYESIAKTNIVIWNNESQSITFNFLTKDLKDCTFEQNNMVVEGNSFGYNIVMCPFPVEKTIGKVIIEGGGCDSSINTSLEVSVKGLLLSLFFGKMGFYSLGLYLVIFMIIAMMVIK